MGGTMRHQFVLDKRSNKILNELAQYRGGNRSRVVREALLYFADMEQNLERIEADPAFLEMMRRSDEDVRAGRVVSHEEVKRQLRRRQKSKK
jgi:predicted transcriptional regulator